MTTDSTTNRPAASVVSGHFGGVAVVGLLSGFLAGLFGVGGGILIVPGLVFVVGMDQRRAHGTSLAAVIPISLASMITYAVQGNVDWWAAVWLSAGAMAGAVLGTKLLDVLPQRTLGLLFAAALLASAVRLFFDTDADGREPLSWGGALLLVAIGVLTGVMAGLLGIGGGVVMVPAMILFIGIPPVLAKGTSAAVSLPTAVVGTARNRRTGNADLGAAAVVGIAGVGTAVVGGIIADEMSADLSNVLFAILLTVVAVRLLWQLRRR